MVFRRNPAALGLIAALFGAIGFVLGVVTSPQVRVRVERINRARDLDRMARKWQAEMEG